MKTLSTGCGLIMRSNFFTFILVISLLFGHFDNAFGYSERERNLFSMLKCMACDGQSIEGSEAEFAKSMREYISLQIESGKTDNEIFSQIRQTYGDEIFFEPPYEKVTYILWFLPLLLVIMGILVVVFVQKKYKPEENNLR